MGRGAELRFGSDRSGLLRQQGFLPLYAPKKGTWRTDSPHVLDRYILAKLASCIDGALRRPQLGLLVPAGGQAFAYRGVPVRATATGSR